MNGGVSFPNRQIRPSFISDRRKQKTEKFNTVFQILPGVPADSDKLKRCSSLEDRKVRACYFTIYPEVNSPSVVTTEE